MQGAWTLGHVFKFIDDLKLMNDSSEFAVNFKCMYLKYSELSKKITTPYVKMSFFSVIRSYKAKNMPSKMYYDWWYNVQSSKEQWPSG